MPQIETRIDIAQGLANIADDLTEQVCLEARKRCNKLADQELVPVSNDLRRAMCREIEKVVAVQILDGTRQNAGNGTDGVPGT